MNVPVIRILNWELTGCHFVIADLENYSSHSSEASERRDLEAPSVYLSQVHLQRPLRFSNDSLVLHSSEKILSKHLLKKN